MNAPVFASTGPAGHRGRMRERLLAHGGESLADYEIVEMLLFLGIQKGDTKPLAKGLINHFGSLGAVLAADPAALAGAGLDDRAVIPLRLTVAAAERLSRRELQVRPLLGSLTALEAHLRGHPHPGTRLLFLDNRNRLLGEEPATLDDEHDHTPVRAILRTALALHATALLVADEGRPLDRRAARAAVRLRQAGAMLAIVLHDRVSVAPADLLSYRRAGLL